MAESNIVKRIVTMRGTVKNAAGKAVATPSSVACGGITARQGEAVEVELDLETREGREKLRSLRTEPCVRCETEQEHKERVAAEKAKTEEERKKAEAQQKQKGGGEHKGGGKGS